MNTDLYDKNIPPIEYIKEIPIPNISIKDICKNTPGCTILNYETLEECSSNLKDDNDKHSCFIVRIPVVLSVLEIEMNINADLILEEPASDIIRSSDNIFLKECRLLPLADKLFLSGFIRKSVEYAPWVRSDEPQSVTVRQCVFNIPFKYVAKVDYYTPPQISINSDEKANHYNEKILCELISSEFHNDSCYEEDRPTDDIHCIQKLGERIIARITLKLLQKQDVRIITPASK